ncbi:hypothetical protein PIB30_066541 [Stylosanthes scabra]|uniref:MADS-box domain-containing protein n=1 Tax=Stylosanthes scabra TaxID=79078 RepID=A0ABU6UL36_9FABA|nr:hypothetical protein [Stylosanthes scabra]
MGRVKLPIKKIENTTNRQVTFSKRRNGLVKKAYELSVLCDVHVALIMFSPSGRPTLFSSNTSIEEILERYINLPPQERKNPVNTDSQLEEIQREYFICKSQLEEMEKRLRIFECNPCEITTLCEAEYRQHVLQETLKQVQLRKCALEEEFNFGASQQAHLAKTVDVNGLFVGGTSKNAVEWLPQEQGDPNVHILSFGDAYAPAPAPLGDQQSHSAAIDMLAASSTNTIQLQMNPKNNSSEACILAPEFGQVTDISSSSWEQLHHLGTNHYLFVSSDYHFMEKHGFEFDLWSNFDLLAGNGSLSVPEARVEGQLIEQYLSQFPSLDILVSNQHHQT